MNFKTSLTCYCVEFRYYTCFQVSHGQNRANHTPHFLINGLAYHLTMQGTPNISCLCFFFLCSITFAPALLDTHFILNSLCHSNPFVDTYIWVLVVICYICLTYINSYSIQFLIYFTNDIFEIALHCSLKMQVITSDF